MSAADEAERLRERADALDTVAKLETKLAEAKDAYRADTGDAKAKERLHKVRDDLVAARQTYRQDRVGAVGGDAFISNTDDGNEG